MTMCFRYLILLVVALVLASPPLVTHRIEEFRDIKSLSSIRLSNTQSDSIAFYSVEREVSLFMNKWHINGASVAIAKEGRLVYARGFGLADTTALITVEPYHRFRIASVSKLITAAAIMKLCEEGLISINDRVFGADGILADSVYSNIRDRRAYDITIGHLLAHRGGWSLRYGDHMFISHTIAKLSGLDLPLKTEDYVRFALERNLHFTPGSGSSYSNLGYVILGLVIEAITDMTYQDFCRQEILIPVGAFDAFLGHSLPEAKLAYEVTYYEQADAIPKLSVFGTGEMVPARYGGNDIESLGAAGGWVATAPDLMRFLLSINGKGYRYSLLSNETISLMTNRRNGSRGLGWGFISANGDLWRTGYYPGTTAMMKSRRDDISWVVLLNTNGWNGPELTNEINYMMRRAIAGVSQWPESDLFRYSLPLPLPDSEVIMSYDFSPGQSVNDLF